MKAKNVSILYHDGRVARCFEDRKKCREYMRARVEEYKSFYTILGEGPSLIQYKDEFGIEHMFTCEDYDLE